MRDVAAGGAPVSSCGVCLSGADEYFDFYDCTYPKARKPRLFGFECGDSLGVRL